ncbi:AraC family transcriptional regulator [Clostridium oryzae]|uniref:Bifunctional transcriptional activator/DNA repair enzyme AdaA n=1 Tax=Clostridium oryzae TaxID=1450648 RepID=A0A1V4IBD1_9CLOT|nr:AraC family transcriptional regulator [Clostridium oryzae]OPJ57312.1 bifunctional transcriptional activator/DNA repair enzyme AdaA [Clostridium oryzae]
MSNMVFPIITDFESKLPVYLGGVGCHHPQEYVIRPKGYPYLQWIQCINGNGELILDQKTIKICEGQGMLLYANIPHEYYAIGSQWKVNWISIGGFGAEDMFKKSLSENSGVFTISKPDVIEKGIELAFEMAISDRLMKSLECSKIVYDLIVNIIVNVLSDEEELVFSQYSKLKPIFDYIDDNYNRVITLEELSSIANLTPQYLCTIFKKIKGIRVFEYINSVRIKNSKEMILKYKHMSIKEISYKCGYEDSSYFCSIFKKQEKITPGEFKKLHGV